MVEIYEKKNITLDRKTKEKTKKTQKLRKDEEKAGPPKI